MAIKTPALALLGLLVIAASNDSAATVQIIGTPTCGTWVNHRGAFERGWLAGYLSGVVAGSGEDALRGSEFPSFELWMDKFCRENPLEDLNVGSNRLVRELLSRKKSKQ